MNQKTQNKNVTIPVSASIAASPSGTRSRRCCRGLTAVIRLHRTTGDEQIRALFARFGNQKFQLAGLVPAECQPGLVIALDEDTRSIQGFG